MEEGIKVKQLKLILLIVSSLTLSACLGPLANSQGTSSTKPVTDATQTSSTPTNTTSMITTSSSQGTTTTQITTPEEDNKIAASYPADQEVFVDLDGDGIDEKIVYKNRDLVINDESYFKVVENDLDPVNSPITDEFVIVNLDQSDNKRQILLNVNGPSDDPEGFFYQYSEVGLKRLGSVPTSLKSLKEQFDGQGIISGLMRLSVLQTWFAQAQWQLTESNTIELVPNQLFKPEMFDYMEPVVLTVDLPIYKEMGDSVSYMELEPQTVEFLATDNLHWVQIKGADGNMGWFKVNSFDNITDLNQNAQDVFENLFSAG